MINLSQSIIGNGREDDRRLSELTLTTCVIRFIGIVATMIDAVTNQVTCYTELVGATMFSAVIFCFEEKKEKKCEKVVLLLED